MKLFLRLLAAASLSAVCACDVARSTTGPSAIAVDTALMADGFDAAFYRAFLQNGYERPDRLEPVRRLPGGPLRIYLRTTDDAGRVIDAVTLATTERVLIDSTPIWSGGQFGVSEVLRGTGTREKVPGWLTVKWSRAAAADRCGESTVGIDGGFIEFNDLGNCSCGMASRIYPRLVRHELGHAMGYYHTDAETDVMYGRTIAPDGCNLLPSDRERRYARYAYTQSYVYNR